MIIINSLLNRKENMEILEVCLNAINAAKGKDIKIYETKNINPLFDYAVLATVSTSRQLNAVAHHAEDEAYKNGYKIRGIEGRNGGSWLLIDMYDVIINVFTEEERERFDLDRLWRDLKQIEL